MRVRLFWSNRVVSFFSNPPQRTRRSGHGTEGLLSDSYRPALALGPPGTLTATCSSVANTEVNNDSEPSSGGFNAPGRRPGEVTPVYRRRARQTCGGGGGTRVFPPPPPPPRDPTLSRSLLLFFFSIQ